MLDEFGNELDATESKIDSTVKKVIKVLHINNGEFLRESKKFNRRLSSNGVTLSQDSNL